MSLDSYFLKFFVSVIKNYIERTVRIVYPNLFDYRFFSQKTYFNSIISVWHLLQNKLAVVIRNRSLL